MVRDHCCGHSGASEDVDCKRPRARWISTGPRGSFRLRRLSHNAKLTGRNWGNRGADAGGAARGVVHCPALKLIQ
eukprot:9468768-Pyramimonas_sp.AAC.1